MSNSPSILLNIPLSQIRAAEDQPRKTFYMESLQELAASIKERGVLEPIVVRPIEPMGTIRYEIIMGERRFRASKLAGKMDIPAIVREMSDEDAAADALLENFQREDLNPIERSRAIHSLLTMMSAEKVCAALGISDTTMRRALELLNLPEDIQEALVTKPGDDSSGFFGESHARLLTGFGGDPQVQRALVKKIREERMSVAQLEQIVAAMKEFPEKQLIFLKVSSTTTDQMVRSFGAKAARKKPYKPQVAKDQFKNLHKQGNVLTDAFDPRITEFLNAEEMSQLLATMAQLESALGEFTMHLRESLENKDFGFRETYIHCPLCGRIELVGATKCSVCWTILKRCVDCGHYDKAGQSCRERGCSVSEDEADSPTQNSTSFKCPDFAPRYVPQGVPLPLAA
jgi:ParB/RepB/Spo0J family partition protein